MEPTRVEKIDNESILIFDDFFTRKQIVHYHDLFSLSNFTFLHSSRNDTAKYREWMAGFSEKDFESHPLHEVSRQAARKLINKDTFIYMVFCNASRYGDHSFTHSDSDNHSSISILYYVNSKWESEWGGETLFYDSQKEPKIAIGFKPGRLIVFKSTIIHKAGVPSKLCPEVRLTLSVRFDDKGLSTHEV